MRAYRPSRFSVREDAAPDPEALMEKETKLRQYAERVAAGMPLFEAISSDRAASSRAYSGKTLHA